ncbi:MAG: hypothetical protein H7A43_06855 [Verrucomicrobia bacterium]|nr:hypothetical protein [Verrucomicrobiota bacterium]
MVKHHCGWRWGLLACLTLAAGCVTETLNSRENALAETRLVVTRAGEEVNLSWRSEPGLVYTVYHTAGENLSGRWEPLPGAEQVRGTGDMIYLKDTVPASRQRYYRLQITSGVVQKP